MKTLTYFRSGALISVIALAACASAGGGRTEGPTVPVDIVVKNNLLLPQDITVYAVTYNGHRTLLGSVHPHDTASFVFKPVAFSEQYRLMAIRSRGRNISSELFSFVSSNTGKITWTMIPNIIGFEGLAPDTSMTADTTSDTTRTGP